MLNTLRKGAGSLVAKIFLGVLVLSFAVWGIADIFRGYGSGALASVGGQEITVTDFRNQLQTETQRISQQIGRPITTQQARAIGLDQRVLGELLAQATLDAQVSKLRLGISQDQVVKSITDDPIFKGANGRFDVNRFDQILRANGLNEQRFVASQRKFLLRREIIDGLAGGATVPRVMLEAALRHQNEARAISYVVLRPEMITDLPEPDETALKTFFEERKAAFRSPDRRGISVLALDIRAQAQKQTVSDEEVAQRYEAEKARFTTPERRTVERIPFPSLDEAKAAAEKVKAGTSFEDIAKERNVQPADYQLGSVSKTDIIDGKLSEGTFALADGAAEAVQGDFGTYLVRASGVQAAVTQPLAEVATQIRGQIAIEKARSAVLAAHDEIEKLRGEGSTLGEIAKRLSLTLAEMPPVDRQGKAADGSSPLEAVVSDPARVVQEAFASDVGVENDAIQTQDGGYIWYDVSKVEPGKERSFEEAKADVLSRWQAQERRKKLDEKAAGFVAALSKNETNLPELALKESLEVMSAEPFTRQAGTPALDRAGIAQVFATKAEGFGQASGAESETRVVFQVTEVRIPPFNPDAPETRELADRLSSTIETDLATQYVQKLQSDFGARINQQQLAIALGASEG